MKVILCAIVKMEGRYLEEFCSYYEKLGFDEIILYDNNTYGTPMSDLEQEDQKIMTSIASEKVKIVPWRNKKDQQIPVYNLQLQALRKNEDTWGAFFDIDEFLVLKQHKSIKDFIEQIVTKNPQAAAVAINWYMFGTNGHQEYAEGKVVERFTTRMPNIDIHVKSIVRACKVSKMQDPHSCVPHHGYVVVDPKNNCVVGPFNKNGSADVAVLHHYFTKSVEEFQQKIERGRADIQIKRKLQEMDSLKFATVTDLSAQRELS